MASIPAITITITIVNLILLASATTLINDDNNGVISSSSKQREFDFFILSLQWAGTFCKRTHKCCKNNGCCNGPNAPMEFTIHGLWPQYNDGTWPACCTNSDFDMKEISTLQGALNKYWPTLSCGSPSTCHGRKGPFWAHEWEKHGTCASPVTGDEYNYFLTTLNLYFKYNVTKVLNEARYVPSNSEKYPLGGIISAIENAFHLSPSVVCSGDAVVELRLCFDKTFKPRDCVTHTRIEQVVDSSKSSCPKYVSLPIYASSGRVIKVDRSGWILALFITICLWWSWYLHVFLKKFQFCSFRKQSTVL